MSSERKPTEDELPDEWTDYEPEPWGLINRLDGWPEMDDACLRLLRRIRSLSGNGLGCAWIGRRALARQLGWSLSKLDAHRAHLRDELDILHEHEREQQNDPNLRQVRIPAGVREQVRAHAEDGHGENNHTPYGEIQRTGYGEKEHTGMAKSNSKRMTASSMTGSNKTTRDRSRRTRATESSSDEPADGEQKGGPAKKEEGERESSLSQVAELDGQPVYLVTAGPCPYERCEDETDGDHLHVARPGEGRGSPTFLPPRMTADELTTEEAERLAAMPETLGEHPETGEPVKVGIGRYGPYVVTGDQFEDLDPEKVDPLHVRLDTALHVLAGKRLRTPFGGPRDGSYWKQVEENVPTH